MLAGAKKIEIRNLRYGQWAAALVVAVFVALIGVFPDPALANFNCGDTASGGARRECACGDMVTTNYTLTSDLVCDSREIYDNGTSVPNPRAALIADADNIVIDCAGHSIILDALPSGGGGTPPPAPNDRPFGIRNGRPSDCALSGTRTGCHDNVTIKNCRIRGYYNSITAYDADDWTIQDNRFEGRFRESTPDANEAAIMIGPSSADDIRILRNTFWSPYVGVNAFFNPAGGRNIDITYNEVLDSLYAGMQLSGLKRDSDIAFNRITVTSVDSGMNRLAALWLFSAEGDGAPRVPVKVNNNFLDCYDPGGAGVSTDCTAGDLALVNTAVSIDAYDNVFSGTGWLGWGSVTPVSVDWCPTGQKKNVFSQSLVTGGKVPAVTGGSICTAGGLIPKACLNETTICGAGNCPATIDITENTCLEDAVWTFADQFPVAFQVKADNVALECGFSSGMIAAKVSAPAEQMIQGVVVDGTEEGGVPTPSNLMTGWGITGNGLRERVTINDCTVTNAREGFRLKNAQHALLRENVAMNTQAGKQQYHYRVISDPAGSAEPDFDARHYKHYLYNPFVMGDVDGMHGLNWLGGAGSSDASAAKLLYYWGWDNFTSTAFGPGVCTNCFLIRNNLDLANAAHFDPAHQFGSMGHLTVATSSNVVIEGIRLSPANLTRTLGEGDGVKLAGVTNSTLRLISSESAVAGFHLLASSGITMTDCRADFASQVYNGVSKTGNGYGLFTQWAKDLTVTGTAVGAGYASIFSSSERPIIDDSGNWVGEVGVELHGYADSNVDDNLTISNSTVKLNQRGGVLAFDIDRSDFFQLDLSDNGYDDDDTDPVSSECSDGVDNDADGVTDYGIGPTFDPECAQPADASEGNNLPTFYLQHSNHNKIYLNNWSVAAEGNALLIAPQVVAGAYDYDLTSNANWVYRNDFIGLFHEDVIRQIGGRNFYGWVGGYGSTQVCPNDPGAYPNSPCLGQTLLAWPDPAAFPPATTANNRIIPLVSGSRAGIHITNSGAGSFPGLQGDRIYNNDVGRIDRDADGIDSDEMPLDGGGIILDSDGNLHGEDSNIAHNRVENNGSHQIYLSQGNGNQLHSNTVRMRWSSKSGVANAVPIGDGIRVANTVGFSLLYNLVETGEGRYGVNIVNSEVGTVQNNRIKDPNTGGDHWPFLNVGIDAIDYPTSYNFGPDSYGNFNHGIYQSNRAGREDAGGGDTLLRALVYVGKNNVYLADNTFVSVTAFADRRLTPNEPPASGRRLDAANLPSHLQIAWSQAWTVNLNGVTLTDIDPVEFNHFTHDPGTSPTYIKTPASVNRISISNCRSACKLGTGRTCTDGCFVIDSSSGQPKASASDSGGTCPVSGSCCDYTTAFSNLTITSAASNGSGHGMYLNRSDCNVFSALNFTGFNGSNRSGVYGVAINNSSYNTFTHTGANCTSAPTTDCNQYNASKPDLQDVWELKLIGDSDRNDFQKNRFLDQGTWEAQCQTNTSAGTGDGCCNATVGNGCDIDCGTYWDVDSYDAVDPDCGSITQNPGDGCDPRGNDTDCPLGVVASATKGRTDKDNYCREVGSDSICDPDCTDIADNDCRTGTVSNCTAAADDCCHPEQDDLCDADCPAGNYPPLFHTGTYDCNNDGVISTVAADGEQANQTCRPLYAFDPDCDSIKNNWCDAGTAANLNNFASLSEVTLNCRRDDNTQVACGWPNYSLTAFGFTSTQFGGGRPLGSLNCNAPTVRFDATGTYTQRQILRTMTLAERINMPGRFEGLRAEFGDVDGANLAAGVRWSREVAASTDPYTGTVREPYHTSGSFYIPPTPPAAGAIASTLAPAPSVTASGDWRDLLGIGTTVSGGVNPIRTTRGSAWSNLVTFNWYGNSSFTGTNMRGWYWLDMQANDGAWNAFSGPESAIAGIPDTATELQQRRRVFLDTQGPTLGAPNFNLQFFPATVNLPPDPPPPSRQISLTWTPVVTCVTPGSSNCEDTAVGVTRSWTPGIAHYEIWYGIDEDEVNARRDLDGLSAFPNSVYVWEDIAFGSSGLPHEPNCTWDMDFPPNGAGGDKDCYDSALSNITTGATAIYTNITSAQAPQLYFQICAVDNFGNETCYSTGARKGVQTLYGDVYSGGDLINQDQPTYANATYQLVAGGGITKWTTSGGAAAPYVNPLYPKLAFPAPENNYTTSYGSLTYLVNFDDDTQASYDALAAELRAIYGDSRVEVINAFSEINDPLGGKIYICSKTGCNGGGDTANFNASRVFTNGTGDVDGSGLIIVNGNLRFTANATYGTGSVSKRKNLASVGWLVFGDVLIDGSVTQTDGAFLVFGKPGTPRSNVLTDSRYGKVVSCASGSCSANQLTVRGLMVARYFDLGRTKAQLSAGSEVIIYDGRVMANIPPGLEQAVSAIPRWAEGN